LRRIGGVADRGGEQALRRTDFAALLAIPTRWDDEDVYGHVNNVVHYAMFDTAIAGWLMTATGVDVRALPAIGVVVETSCRYFAELRYPEVVTAGIGLDRLGWSSVAYRIALFGEEGVAPAAVGRFVHVYVDRDTRRPVPVPDVVRSALGTLRPPPQS
jgi:acyl-CoA thioester hydrolase